MNVTYRRELRHNYLIIEPEEERFGGYERWMLMENGIEGLLRFRVKYLDSKEYYYYEITSKQPLYRLLESHSLSAGEFRTLLMQMMQVLGRMEAFLLSEDQILLEPEFIYVLPETFQVSLCLIPGRKTAFWEAMSRFLQYLLGKVDHQDKECLVLAYGLYQESLRDNYGIEGLMKCLITVEGKVAEPVSEDVRPKPESEAAWERGAETEIRPPNNSWKWLGLTITHLIGCGILYGILGIPEMVPYAAVLCAVSWLIWAPVQKPSFSFNKKKQVQKEPESWKMVFQEEAMEIRDSVYQEDFCPEGKDTVLLNGQNHQPNVRRLVSLDGGADIVLPYFPFIIGKQEGLVDCVLSQEAVSRLHLRIDQDEEGYKITDLNSTNGTIVNTHVLEANEMSNLVPEDEIFVANVGFRFI